MPETSYRVWTAVILPGVGAGLALLSAAYLKGPRRASAAWHYAQRKFRPRIESREAFQARRTAALLYYGLLPATPSGPYIPDTMVARELGGLFAKPGMRVAQLDLGHGKTTISLHELARLQHSNSWVQWCRRRRPSAACFYLAATEPENLKEELNFLFHNDEKVPLPLLLPEVCGFLRRWGVTRLVGVVDRVGEAPGALSPKDVPCLLNLAHGVATARETGGLVPSVTVLVRRKETWKQLEGSDGRQKLRAGPQWGAPKVDPEHVRELMGRLGLPHRTEREPCLTCAELALPELRCLGAVCDHNLEADLSVEKLKAIYRPSGKKPNGTAAGSVHPSWEGLSAAQRSSLLSALFPDTGEIKTELLSLAFADFTGAAFLRISREEIVVLLDKQLVHMKEKSAYLSSAKRDLLLNINTVALAAVIDEARSRPPSSPLRFDPEGSGVTGGAAPAKRSSTPAPPSGEDSSTPDPAIVFPTETGGASLGG
eukprot:RCo013363